MTSWRKIILNTSQTIERTALTQLVTNEQYARKVLPFMKGDYFSDFTERTIFEEIAKFVDKYNKIPTQTSLEIEVSSRKDLTKAQATKLIDALTAVEEEGPESARWDKINAAIAKGQETNNGG